jgi:hypothetical protein
MKAENRQLGDNIADTFPNLYLSHSEINHDRKNGDTEPELENES